MHPEIDELGAVGAGRLGDLVLVMREDQILPAAMDVEGLAEMPLRHRRAFEMPAGPAPPPRALPAGLVGIRRLPEDEIGRVALVGRDFDPRAGDQLVPAVARQPAVIRHRRDREQHMPVGGIGVLPGDQLFDHRDHPGDMLGRPRLDTGFERAERRHVGLKHRRVAPGDRIDRLARAARRLDDLVVDIGDVARIGDAALAIDMTQQAVQHVEHDDRARIADMGMVVDRRPADIEPDIARIYGLEHFLAAAQRVVEGDRHRRAPAQSRPLKALTMG